MCVMPHRHEGVPAGVRVPKEIGREGGSWETRRGLMGESRKEEVQHVLLRISRE